jgi:hypothetical protein
VATETGATFPTAPLAQASPTVTARAAVTLPTVQARPNAAGAAAAAEETTPATNSIMIWLGVTLLVVLIGMSIGIIVFQRRWR